METIKMTGKNEVTFFACATCRTMVERVGGDSRTLSCCATLMQRLLPNTVDASLEKHKPVLKRGKDGLEVQVGEILHPMSFEHYIEWIIVVYDNRVSRIKLLPGQNPSATICLKEETTPQVYAYCNLHGLWKAD